LVYEVNSEESAELGLLDVSDWKMQTISSVGLQMVDTEFVEENNDGISYSHLAFRIWVIGWTPLEDIIQN
jgi:hypothetical protein